MPGATQPAMDIDVDIDRVRDQIEEAADAAVFHDYLYAEKISTEDTVKRVITVEYTPKPDQV